MFKLRSLLGDDRPAGDTTSILDSEGGREDRCWPLGGIDVAPGLVVKSGAGGNAGLFVPGFKLLFGLFLGLFESLTFRCSFSMRLGDKCFALWPPRLLSPPVTMDSSSPNGTGNPPPTFRGDLDWSRIVSILRTMSLRRFSISNRLLLLLLADVDDVDVEDQDPPLFTPFLLLLVGLCCCCSLCELGVEIVAEDDKSRSNLANGPGTRTAPGTTAPVFR